MLYCESVLYTAQKRKGKCDKEDVRLHGARVLISRIISAERMQRGQR